MKLKLALCSLMLATAALSGQNQNISQGIAFDGEPFLAIDPANSSHLVVLWMGYDFGKPIGIKSRVSFNGGQSWSSAKLLPHVAPSHQSADPSMVFDNAGNVHACYVDYRKSPDSGGVFVIKSVDGGLNWGTAVKVIDAYADGSKRPLDRPWIGINPLNNHLYISTKPAPWIPIPCRPYFMASTNAGQSWSPWRYVDTAGFLVGDFIQAPMAMHATGADGVLHMLYPSYKTSQNVLPGFIHAKSVNDGQSFTYNGAFYSFTGASDTNAKMGYRLLVNPSNANHLAFIYLGAITGDLDVYVTESLNSGSTWSNAIRVNDDIQANGKMQDLVWANFDTDGDLLVGWRDRRNAPGNGYSTASEIMAAVRWKDSISFSKNFNLSDSLIPFHPVLTGNGNDFLNVVMHNDSLYGVWGDVRNNKLHIWFQRKSLKNAVAGYRILLDGDLEDPIQIFPNPSGNQIYFKGDKVKSARFFDALGKLVLESVIPADQVLEIKHLLPGHYTVQVVCDSGNYFVKFKKE